MGWLSGVLSGYADSHAQTRQENAKLAEEAAKRESAIYQALLSSPDDETKAMAATGIMQMGQPRKGKGGFAGWMGEMQSSPIYPVLMKHISTPKPTEVPVTVSGLPSTQTQGYLSLPPGQTPTLAQPESSPTEGGEMATPKPLPASLQPPAPPYALAEEPEAMRPPAPPPALEALSPEELAAPSPAPPPPPVAAGFTSRQVAGPAAVQRTETRMQLPHAFPTVEETTSAAAVAKQKADIQADAWMYQQAHPEWSPQEAYQAAAKLAESHAGGRAGGLATTYIKGGVLPDPNSPTGFSRQWVLRSDPTRVQMLPEQPPNTPEYEYLKTRARRIATYGMTPEQALEGARKDYPQGTQEEHATMAQYAYGWSQQMMAGARNEIPNFGQVRPGVGAPPPTLGAPPPTLGAQPGAPGAQPPPGGAAAPAAGAPITSADPGAAAAAPGAPAAGGAAPSFAGSIAPGYQDVSPRTNKPLSAAPQQAVNEARATDALVDRALATLEPYKDLNEELDGLEMALNYKKGIEDQLGVAAQIANLAALQSSATKALSAGGSRAYQFVVDKQQHTPRLPSDEQIAKYQIATEYLGMDPKEAAKWVSLYFRNKDKPAWDSPKTMIEKLQVIKQNLHDYINDAMNIDITEPGPGTNPNAVPVQPPPRPPASVTGGRGGGPGAAGAGRGGASTPAPTGRVDINSDIVYGPNGATVVGR